MKIKVCIDCHRKFSNATKLRCSPCNRKFKRRNKPSFYLGTCYSEIKRRCIRKIPNREYSVYGKDFCTRTEFINRFIEDEEFLKNFKNWQENGYTRGIAPSIDRIDDEKGYTIDNLQFLSNNENARKFSGMKVNLLDKDFNFIRTFDCQASLAKYIKISPSVICVALKNKSLISKKYRVVKYEETI